MPGAQAGKLGVSVTDEFTQPDVAEIHQLCILHVTEIGWIREDRIKRDSLPQLRGVATDQVHLTTLGRPNPVAISANPFSRNRDFDFLFAFVPDFERTRAVAFGLGEFLRDVEPASAPHRQATRTGDTE